MFCGKQTVKGPCCFAQYKRLHGTRELSTDIVVTGSEGDTVGHRARYEYKLLLSGRFRNKSVPVCLCMYCLFNYSVSGSAHTASRDWTVSA
jgi:hypothetical protein